MKNQTGYRQMLRDRLPRYVSDALRWRKAKEAWLDHVYKNFIWIYVSNKERLEATKRVLGYKESLPREFKFEDTIDWNNLDDGEKNYWEDIRKWVSWFTKTVPCIEDDYLSLKKKGHSQLEIKQKLMLKWFEWLFPTKEDSAKVRKKKNKDLNEILDYLIDCFEKHIN